MALSKDITLYSDCKGFLDRVVRTERVQLATFDTPGRASHFRQRCYKFRALMRVMYLQLPDDDPFFGKSDYDDIVIDIAEGTVVRASPGRAPIFEEEFPDGTIQPIEFVQSQKGKIAPSEEDESLTLDLSAFGQSE